MKWNWKFNLTAENESSNITFLRKKKILEINTHWNYHLFKTELSRTNFRWRLIFSSLPTLGQNQEECFAPFQIKMIAKERKPAKNRNRTAFGALTLISIHFLGQFLSLSFSHVFDDFRKLNSISNHAFRCPWHLRTSFEWFLMKLGNFSFSSNSWFFRPKISSIFEKFRHEMKLKIQSDCRKWNL